jgi:hypothetical protein
MEFTLYINGSLMIGHGAKAVYSIIGNVRYNLRDEKSAFS